MTAETVDAYRGTETFFELDSEGRGRPIAVTDRFWEDLASGALTIDGRLVCIHDMAESMPHWERHPLGEELICLISGAVDAILDEAPGARTIRLATPGDICLVPRGVWHHFEVRSPARLLFVTFGEGTDHKPA